MEKLLFKTIQVLEILNKQIPYQAITKQEFNEEKENIGDLLVLQQKIDGLLEHLTNKEVVQNKDLVNEYLVHMYLNYSYMVWHFEQIDNLIKKILTTYPD